jgi:phosphonate transport system substrate-binding protein
MPGSYSGCLLVRHHLLRMGETEAFFGCMTFWGRHQESIRMVMSEEVGCGGDRLARPRRRTAAKSGTRRALRVIATLGPSTIPPVVATTRLPDAVQVRVRDALCELGTDPASREVLASGLIRRFTPIDDRAYDDIRQKLALVERSVPSR